MQLTGFINPQSVVNTKDILWQKTSGQQYTEGHFNDIREYFEMVILLPRQQILTYQRFENLVTDWTLYGENHMS